MSMSEVLYLSQDPVFPAITKGANTCVYTVLAITQASKVLPKLYCAQHKQQM